ncbi:ABC transporter permease subunit [Calidifontibacillus oryziterrae]|uniref:ABC transporter permease subunit n=1 Tax=Calidifontibacillus oryziterrae TaxID=1191699 RepID=UPI0002E8568C|nr:ABC transporter permease subunit [Calidifontibacillus oryziterrae]
MNYIWKEWKEQSRGKGIWISLAMVVLLSLFILLEAKSIPSEQGFTVFLLSLHEMNVFILPLLSLFIASFAIIQEKELKTLMILTTKRETYRSFLLKKSIAIHAVTLAIFVSWYFIFALIMKLYFVFNIFHFLVFLSTVITFIVVFNQIGLFLGSICNTRMQLIGANIFTWFLFVFLTDLLFLYFLPAVSYDNITIFSLFFFLDPLHSIRFYLESSLGVFSLEHMSRLMEKMVWASPSIFLLLDLAIWLVISFELSSLLRGKGEQV